MKLALVTGASKGIGREIAIALADAGHKVIAVSRTPMAKYENIENICGDVSDIKFVNSLQKQVSQDYGDVQILVNAGGTRRESANIYLFLTTSLTIYILTHIYVHIHTYIVYTISIDYDLIVMTHLHGAYIRRQLHNHDK